MRRRVRACANALAIAGGLALSVVASAGADQEQSSSVVYIAGSSVYVAAGRDQGIAEGDTLRMMSGGTITGRLVVTAVSSNRAVCDTLGLTQVPAIGDAVRFSASTATAAVPVDSTMAAPGAQDVATRPVVGARRATRPVRGRIGLRYIEVKPDGTEGYSQPALDLRLDAKDVGGRTVDLSTDIRTRRTYRPEGNEDLSRVYRMTATFRLEDHFHVTVGRQLSSALSSISIFDGLLTSSQVVPGVEAGLFVGTQPDPANYSPSSDVFETGAYVQLRNRAAGPRRWSTTLSGVASYDHGFVNRQFLAIEGNYSTPKFFVLGSQEVEFNPVWKRDLGDPQVSFSSTFISARGDLMRNVQLNAGYDSRRNIRLYRDVLTPEIEFDDALRQGAWIGLSAELVRHVRLMSDGRWNGDRNSSLQSQSGSAELFGLPLFNTRMRYRFTRYESALSNGTLHSGGVTISPMPSTSLEWAAGVRSSHDAFASNTVHWQSVDADVGLTRSSYLLLSAAWDRGEGFNSTLTQAGLTWRF